MRGRPRTRACRAAPGGQRRIELFAVAEVGEPVRDGHPEQDLVILHLDVRALQVLEDGVADAQAVAAFQRSFAHRLRFVQVHADVIPSKTADETVFSAISNYAGFGLSALKFLVVREK